MANDRYSDWDIAKAQKAQIEAGLDEFTYPYREVQVRKYIAGVVGSRISEELRAGLWLKPLGSEGGITFSCTQDVTHSSLFIICQPSSTGDSDGTPRYDDYRQMVRRLFDNRRGLGSQVECEVYSYVKEADYEIDERLQRKMDVTAIVISTVIRELR